MSAARAEPVGGLTRKIRFVVSGVINTAVDFGIFSALILWSGLSPFLSNLLAFAAAVCCSFLLNRLWTFADRPKGSPLVFLLWMLAIALLSSWILARLAGFGVHLVLAKLAATALVMVLSYQAMNRLVFHPGRAGLALTGGAAALMAAGGLALLFPVPGGARGLPGDLLGLYPEIAAPPVDGPLRVYHLGHSLVGRDMPAMLQQLAGEGHDYASQLGWGTSISEHLQGPDAVNGYAVENAHPRFQPLETALMRGDYDVLVFTEMIGLEAAIRYRDSASAVADLVTAARAANPDLTFALYETWHPLDEGDWLARIPQDRATMWEPSLLAPAIRAAGAPVRIIPAGKVMAALVREVEARPGGIGGMTGRRDLFSDDIHLNDLGHYLVALVHYASLYRRSPAGLPFRLLRADGSPAEAPSPELAAEMQRIVWQVVSSSPLYR